MVLFLIAGVLALFGKNQVSKAVPPEPEAAIEQRQRGRRRGDAAVKDGAGHERRSNGTAGPKPTVEELRAEIQQTRAELGETVQALAAKADVKARRRTSVEQTKERVREQAVADRARSARRRPPRRPDLAPGAGPRQGDGGTSAIRCRAAALAAGAVAAVVVLLIVRGRRR